MRKALRAYVLWLTKEERKAIILAAGKEFVRFCKSKGATGFFINIHWGPEGDEHSQYVECNHTEMMCTVEKCGEVMGVNFVAVPRQVGELLKKLNLAMPMDPLKRDPEDFPGSA